MKVLMFGWEFPPYFSGGLGIACKGLVTALSENGQEVLFVMPKMPTNLRPKINNIRFIIADEIKIKNLKIIELDSLLCPYLTTQEYEEIYNSGNISCSELYGKNIYSEVRRYGELAKTIAKSENFDVIHAHDWPTFIAAVNAKIISKKPLVVHIHNTAYDRTAGNPSKYEYEIEKYGMNNADIVICVSNYIKKRVIENYEIDPNKIIVVHNGCETSLCFNRESFSFKEQDKVVLFLGRITVQKGPDYFLYAAKEILEKDSNVKFVVAGSGDMLPWLIQKTIELGLSKNFIYTGWINDSEEKNRLYRAADVFVMPSVSEPFGLVPLEAIQNGTPVIISKQSGVSEALKTALKVDFWDINELSNKIYAVLNYKALHETMTENGYKEAPRMSWYMPAKKCIEIYDYLLNNTKKPGDHLW